MEDKFYVYVHVCKWTGELKRIGKGKGRRYCSFGGKRYSKEDVWYYKIHENLSQVDALKIERQLLEEHGFTAPRKLNSGMLAKEDRHYDRMAELITLGYTYKERRVLEERVNPSGQFYCPTLAMMYEESQERQRILRKEEKEWDDLYSLHEEKRLERKHKGVTRRQEIEQVNKILDEKYGVPNIDEDKLPVFTCDLCKKKSKTLKTLSIKDSLKANKQIKHPKTP